MIRSSWIVAPRSSLLIAPLSPFIASHPSSTVRSYVGPAKDALVSRGINIAISSPFDFKRPDSITTHLHLKTSQFVSALDTGLNPFIVISIHSSSNPTLRLQQHIVTMEISFDPFNFGATTLALIIAAIELYWARPRRVRQVSALITFLYPV